MIKALQLIAGVALIACGIYHESAVLSLASIIPFVLRSPDDDGGGGGQQDVITIPKKEYEEQLTKRIQTGIADGKGRAIKQIAGLFSKYGLTASDDVESIEKTIESLVGEVKQSKSGKDEQLQSLEAKIKALSEENGQYKGLITQAELDRDNYIINNEIINAATQKSTAPSDVALLLRQSMRMERLKDGSIRVYDASGAVQYNSKGEPMTVAEAVDKFLEQRPYLVKSNVRGSGDGDGDKTGTAASLLEKAMKDPLSLTPEERKKFLEIV